ncbi:MAG: TetR/AcrR family transcriptional regulator [Gammaproteobacteria bacterium]|nr:TetR/AcrR family transcriptional regulator [Gammaproteobacteria bacterium]
MAVEKKTPLDTRALIINTALKLFSEKGIFNTSVQDIKRTANISIGSIYHHFPGKDAIVRALYEELLAKMQDLIEGIDQQYASAHDRCREVVRQIFIMTEYDPDAVRFVLQGRHLEFLPNEQPICSSRPFELMKDMVRDGITAGEIQGGDATLLAACLFGGPLRMVSLRLDGILDRPLPEQLDDVWTCAWRAVSA